MPTDPNATLFAESTCADLEKLIKLLRDECSTLVTLLPMVGDSQWRSSPIPRPREDTSERATGGHGDPTPTIALDEQRLALREQLLRSEVVVRNAAVAVRGARRGLEISLSRWEGVQE